MRNHQAKQEVVGIVPAAGQASRLGLLPCSKEILPIGLHTQTGSPGQRPKVCCQYLLEHLRRAGVTTTYIVLRDGKWDIPHYLGNGEFLGLDLAYLIVSVPFGVPYTLDQAYPFVQHSLVALGFPDIVIRSEQDVFGKLLNRQASSQADVVLGLFEANHSYQVDMVDRDQDGIISKIEIKPDSTLLRYAWILAVWTPVFTQFMHDYLPTVSDPGKQELFVGNVLQAAISNGLHINSVVFTDATYVDIGTPEGLVTAVCSE